MQQQAGELQDGGASLGPSRLFMLEPQPSVERQVFFKPRGWSPVLALVALTLSPVSMQVSQGPAPACAQRGGCGCPQPGPHSGPRGGGVPRRHQPAAAATLPRGHFWLLCGLREWAPGLRYAPSAFWAPQPWDLSKPHWWSELFGLAVELWAQRTSYQKD